MKSTLIKMIVRMKNVVFKRNQIAVDVIPPTDNLSVDHLVSTDNVSTANPSTDIQNSGSMELGGSFSHHFSKYSRSNS